MRDSYKYRKSFHKYRLGVVKRRLGIMLLAVILVSVAYFSIQYDALSQNKQTPAISQAQIRAVTGDLQIFRSTYFQFQDTGKWVLSNRDSTTDKFVYYKYRGLVIEHQLIIYINQEPIPLYLAVSRALPVRLVNGNSLDVAGISGRCGDSYGAKELHKVKTVSLNGANMLCDPDTPQYSVVLAEMGGDWHLRLKRHFGSPVQFVITYRDFRSNTYPDTITRVANSFQAL